MDQTANEAANEAAERGEALSEASGDRASEPGAGLSTLSLTLLGRDFSLRCAPEAAPHIARLNAALNMRLQRLAEIAGEDPFAALALAALNLEDEVEELHANLTTQDIALARAQSRIDQFLRQIEERLGDDEG